MPITSRPYSGETDLRAIQTATAHWIASAGFGNYLHIGDIPLRLFNGMRHYKPSEIVRLWEDNHVLLGWAMVYPRWNSYEALLHPSHRGSDLEQEMLNWCEQETSTWLRREDRANDPIGVDVLAEDTTRMSLLKQRGYMAGKQLHVTAMRSLDELIPDIALPDGFSIRLLERPQEAEKLVAAKNAAFGWAWTAEEYRQVMQSYNYPQIIVVAAPDGRIVSFCYLMLDMWNKIGMFEDVGTIPEFQRKGMGRALLYAGMKQMKTQGMNTAFVPYAVHVDAAAALYTSVGFRIEYKHYRYTKYHQGTVTGPNPI